MKMRIFVFLAIALCAYASETPETESTDEAQVKDKRQSHEGTLTHHAVYRQAKSHEQVAPVMEAQDDERLRNRTSLQPESEDQGEKVDRPTREKPDDAPDSSKDENKIDQPIENSDVSNALPQPQPQVDIHNNGDQKKYDIPPPRDGKSYTPEEFTSLIVSGYSVTPLPDYGFGLRGRSLPVGFGGFPSTVRPPIPFTPGPFPAAPLSPNPYFSRGLPVSSTIAPGLLGLREQPKIGQGHLPHNLEQLKQAQRSLPPPKNNKAYSVEEFNGLLAAGFPVTPVPVAPFSVDVSQNSRHEAEEYRPGQVFSLHPRELLELQPERKAPLASNQLLQHLYANPQQEHKQNLQPFYFLDPQSQGRQVPPSHAVIARPNYSFNGGEASVGAALSVSDNGANHDESFDQELLALLGQAQIRPQEPRPTQATSNVSPQYQQVDRYIGKQSKKSSKIRAKVHSALPQPSAAAPQQYLIETTNVQQLQQQQPQYRPAPQAQRLAQSLRYVPIPAQGSQSVEQFHYERPESGIKVVPAPKLQQQPRAQFNYRVAPQFQQQEASPKQYRILELPRAQPIRQELRIPPSLEKPVAYLKRYPEPEKQRSVKIYDPVGSEGNQQTQLFGDQFVLRPVYRANERPRYELSPVNAEQPRAPESTKAPHSAIYVSKNLPAPRQQKARQQTVKIDQPSNLDYINIEQHGQNLDEQRSQLPPPKNNRAYTPEEFAALVAAGYSVTPVPVNSLNLDVAQSRTTLETVTAQPKRRLTQRRRNQYLPVRDDAP